MTQDPADKARDTIELIFADYDSNNITVIEAMDRADALIDKAEKRAFRNGQIDCQKAGDPSNHVHFQDAIKQLEGDSSE